MIHNDIFLKIVFFSENYCLETNIKGGISYFDILVRKFFLSREDNNQWLKLIWPIWVRVSGKHDEIFSTMIMTVFFFGGGVMGQVYLILVY